MGWNSTSSCIFHGKHTVGWIFCFDAHISPTDSRLQNIINGSECFVLESLAESKLKKSAGKIKCISDKTGGTL